MSTRSSSHDLTPMLVIGGLALLAYLLFSKLGLGAGGGVAPSSGTGTTGSLASAGETNPALKSIGLTAAQGAGSTALSANVGATNPFTITGMTWG